MKSGASQAFVNVVIPFEPSLTDAVNTVLDGLADRQFGNRPNKELKAAIESMGTVHFMSITAVSPRCPADDDSMEPAALQAHLMIEMVVDGGTEDAVVQLARVMEKELTKVFKAGRIEFETDGIASLLSDHCIVIRDTWRGTLGQTFNGSPGQSLQRILSEEKLAKRIGDEIEALRRKKDWAPLTPRERLDRVRHRLWDTDGLEAGEDNPGNRLGDEDSPNPNDMKWAFMPEPTPCLGPQPDDRIVPNNPQIWRVALSIIGKFGWPIYLAVGLLVFAIYWYFRDGQSFPVSLMWGAYAIGSFFTILVAIVVGGYLLLRYHENRDEIDDRTPDNRRVEALLRVENFTAQNHLASVSRLKKPYWFRKLMLRLAFVVVGTGRFVGKPGFLGKNGVIHFARWMLVPHTNQMLFWSNFDGTWASYVGDFIADAPTGVTAIWSNCYGFPRTKRLFGQGAQNRDRLVRWARRQQHPTRLWYQAYPDLTAARIRINAAIRQGIASAQSEADAEDWLAQFGSMVSPPSLLKMTEIPILVFGGLSNMLHATTYLIRLGPDKQACKDWLKAADAAAAYGEMLPGQPSAVVVALTCSALVKLGVPPEAIATFPTAFQQGMSTPWRARVLADLGDSAPEHWDWGGPGKEVDAVITVYGVAQTDVENAWEPLRAALEAGRHPEAIALPLKALPPKARATKPEAETEDETEKLDPAVSSSSSQKSAPAHVEPKPSPAKPTIARVTEPFGYADGVSQPVLRGTPRSHAHIGSDHLIETGEFVLGYPDNLNRLPPSPSIAGEYDPDRYLPDELAGDPLRRNRPEFARYGGTGRRDLGANGTFLVVRQLEQDVDAFELYLRRAADAAASGEQGVSVAIDSTGAIAILGGALPGSWTNIPGMRHGTSMEGAEAVARAMPPRGAAKIVSRRNPATTDELKLIGDFIGARMVGRWKDGTSLVRNPQLPGTVGEPDAVPDNNFRFGVEDPRGLGCPFGSHIRRANPRDTRFPGTEAEIVDTNRHRLLRVGRSYEWDPDGDKKEGLMFMCLNADIERQFEFVQKSWLMNPHIHGLEDETDPLMGNREIHAKSKSGRPDDRQLTIQTSTGPARLLRIPDFVTVKGGAYCFMPGRAVLRFLANSKL